MDKSKQQGKVNIELPAEIAQGVYCNLAIIAHSNAEFVLDFIQMLPNTPKAEVRSRIIMTPFHAKRLLAALRDNIQRFEQSNGEIRFKENGPSFPSGFSGPTGFA